MAGETVILRYTGLKFSVDELILEVLSSPLNVNAGNVGNCMLVAYVNNLKNQKLQRFEVALTKGNYNLRVLAEKVAGRLFIVKDFEGMRMEVATCS